MNNVMAPRRRTQLPADATSQPARLGAVERVNAALRDFDAEAGDIGGDG